MGTESGIVEINPSNQDNYEIRGRGQKQNPLLKTRSKVNTPGYFGDYNQKFFCVCLFQELNML